MKTGKVSQAVLDRSVLRPLSRAGVLNKNEAAFGEDCGVLVQKQTETGKRQAEDKEKMKRQNADQKEAVVASVCGTLGGINDRTVEMLLAAVANNLAAAGARAESVEIGLLFPEDWEETKLKSITGSIGKWCKEQQVTVTGGHTEVSDAIGRPVISITGWGTAEKECLRTADLKPDQDLVMAGYAGLAGTAVLAKNREQELAQRYPFSIIDTAKEFEQHLLIVEAAQAGREFQVSAMHDVSQGGIFAALWEMAECAGVGLDVDLKKIPIRQETIEICEFFDRNPYQLYGQGALLLGTPRGEALVEHLSMLGIPAAVIGQTTSGNDRLIRNGEDARFLDRPAQDALWVKDCSE